MFSEYNDSVYYYLCDDDQKRIRTKSTWKG